MFHDYYVLHVVYIIVRRVARFLIYKNWEQNQRVLGTHINNNYANVLKSKVDSDFRHNRQKTQNVKLLS